MSSLWWLQLHTQNTILHPEEVCPILYEYVAGYAYTHNLPTLYSVFYPKYLIVAADPEYATYSAMYMHCDLSFYQQTHQSKFNQLKIAALLTLQVYSDPALLKEHLQTILDTLNSMNKEYRRGFYNFLRHYIPMSTKSIPFLKLILPLVDPGSIHYESPLTPVILHLVSFESITACALPTGNTEKMYISSSIMRPQVRIESPFLKPQDIVSVVPSSNKKRKHN